MSPLKLPIRKVAANVCTEWDAISLLLAKADCLEERMPVTLQPRNVVSNNPGEPIAKLLCGA